MKSVGILGQKAWVFGLRAVLLVSSHSAPTCTMFLTSLPPSPDGKDADYQFSRWSVHYLQQHHFKLWFHCKITWLLQRHYQGGSLSLQQAHRPGPCQGPLSTHWPSLQAPDSMSTSGEAHVLSDLSADVLGNKLAQEPDANIFHLHQPPGARHRC